MSSDDKYAIGYYIGGFILLAIACLTDIESYAGWILLLMGVGAVALFLLLFDDGVREKRSNADALGKAVDETGKAEIDGNVSSKRR